MDIRNTYFSISDKVFLSSFKDSDDKGVSLVFRNGRRGKRILVSLKTDEKGREDLLSLLLRPWTNLEEINQIEDTLYLSSQELNFRVQLESFSRNNSSSYFRIREYYDPYREEVEELREVMILGNFTSFHLNDLNILRFLEFYLRFPLKEPSPFLKRMPSFFKKNTKVHLDPLRLNRMLDLEGEGKKGLLSETFLQEYIYPLPRLKEFTEKQLLLYLEQNYIQNISVQDLKDFDVNYKAYMTYLDLKNDKNEKERFYMSLEKIR